MAPSSTRSPALAIQEGQVLGKREATPRGGAKFGRNHCLECGGRSFSLALCADSSLGRPVSGVSPAVYGVARGRWSRVGGAACSRPRWSPPPLQSRLELRGQLGRCWAQVSSPGSSWPRVSPAPRHSKCHRWVSSSRGADGGAGAGAGGRQEQLWWRGWGQGTPARRLHLPGT